MSELQFNDQSNLPKRVNVQPKLITFVMKYSGGLIKTRAQAELLLIVISLLVLGYSASSLLESSSQGIQIPSKEIINTPPSAGAY